MKVADILRTTISKLKTVATWIIQFPWLDKNYIKKVTRIKESRQRIEDFAISRTTLMKVADVLRTYLPNSKTWLQLESFNFIDSIKSYSKKLLVLRSNT